MKKEIVGKRIIDACLLVGIFVFLGMIFGVNVLHFNYAINADLASDAVLSALIWDSKEIVPSTWYLASETRIICTPNIGALFYGLTGNMVLAEGLACCLMTVLILLSLLYFAHAIEMNPRFCLLFGVTCLIMPNSFAVLELLYLFASYYAIHVVVLFLTLGIYIEYIKREKISGIKYIISIVLALILGLQGTRGILVIYGPLFGMECIRQIYSFYSGNRKINLRTAVWTLCLLLVSFAGTCFPISIGQDISRNIRNGFPKLLFEVIPDFYSIIGFDKINIVGKICLIIFLLISAGILIRILYCMCYRKSISLSEWGYLVLCSSPVVSVLAVSYTTVESSERYYFLIFFVMAYGCVLAFQKMRGSFKGLLGILVSIYAVVIICNVYVPVIKSDRRPQTEMYDVIDYLIEHDYKLAYSTFDYANTMTVMANNEIKVVPVASVEKMNICRWMSSTEWYVPNVPYEAKTAYIISEPNFESFQVFLKKHEENVFYREKIGNYYIYTSDFNFSNLRE